MKTTNVIEPLYIQWCCLSSDAEELHSETLQILADEKFNEMIKLIASELEKYQIEYSIENLCGDNEYRSVIANKLYAIYDSLDDENEEREKREGEIDRIELYYGEDR